jgi:membrane protein CcdC involved in cytochrome C biogenesis
MAVKIKRSKKQIKTDSILPFDSINFVVMGIGLLFILVGYFLLSKSDVHGFTPLVLSPLLLIIGYCVLIPLGIMYRKEIPPETKTPMEEIK